MSKTSLGRRTVVFPVPVWVVGTYDADGRANAMTASWAGICCSKPPCVAVSLREATYTYGCLMERRAFTIGVPSVDHVREADYLGKLSGRDEDKLAKLGLTAVRAEHVDAPSIEEFPLTVECSLLHDLKIGLHTLFVGEIMDVKADPAILRGKKPDVDAARPFVYVPDAQDYRALGESLGRAFSVYKDVDA